MDVELLRPGTVPISPETVLWFEFLLDKNLLLKYLQKNSSDTSAIDLINKFHEVIYETLRNHNETELNDVEASNETPKPKHPAKNIALKILALKVTAFLNWNLGKIRSLPFKTQINLLQDLLYFTNNNKPVEIPNVDSDNLENCPKAYLFALIVYHRWLLNTAMHRVTTNWHFRFDMSPSEEATICSIENIQKTTAFLTNSLTWTNDLEILTFDCFILPTETSDNIEFDWSKGIQITKPELHAQINFDLGTFYFYKENYDLAKMHFSNCKQYFQNPETCGFSDFDKSILDVYLQACYGSNDDKTTSLLEQLNTSVVNKFVGIIGILQQDNILKEIPISHRMNLELDVQGAISSEAFTAAKDLLIKIKALNIVRLVLEQKPLYSYSTSFFIKNINMLLWALASAYGPVSPEDKARLKHFVLDLLIKDEIPNLQTLLLQNEPLADILEKSDMEYLKKARIESDPPEGLLKSEFNVMETGRKRKPKAELRLLEQSLISTYDQKEIRDILVKIAMTNLGTTVWSINPQWELPIPVQSVLKTLPRGFLQDFSFVLLAKARELAEAHNWDNALEFLIIVDKELNTGNGNVSKLCKLVNWETLLVKITQIIEEWPRIDSQGVPEACMACLQTNDSVLPRSEVTEQCAIALLNFKGWDYLVTCDKRWTCFEIISAIALACQELEKNKGAKKFSKDLWDLVLPIFVSHSQKRGNSNAYGNDSQVSNLRHNLKSVFFKLREPLALSIVISLLAKLYNILKDETAFELQAEHMNLWPAVVTNANSYNTLAVNEFLAELVLMALKYHPDNVGWLRLMGDINFANKHYQISLSFYLKSLLILYDYFNRPVRSDDHVFRRMIKCCTSIGCHTQAAVLCQFLEEPDYLLAFRILGEHKVCNDAVDGYYHCFWDTNILEYLIHVHNKKGEFQRRKCAVQVIGTLELNSNNNDEIQREASNLRKGTFLRALCKQYVL